MNNCNELFFKKIKIKLYALIIIIGLIILFSIDINLTNIPELEFYNNQTIKLLIPSKICKPPSLKTLFLTSDCRNDSEELNNKYKIIHYENKKNSFITYYRDDQEYKQYETLLFFQGIIKSYSIYSDNNIYFSVITNELIKRNKLLNTPNTFQKFDKLFNDQIFMKDTLYINYIKMKNKFVKDYNFMVETYNYPDDRDIIEKKFMNYTLDINDLWLVKPKQSFGGIGIRIFSSLNKLKEKEFLITKYITNLDLINNKKYDFRLYVLISGLKPLRIYFYKEGLVRIAAKNFSLNISSIKNRYIHLTNTGINSKNKDFIVPNNTENKNANIWNLKTYSNHLGNLNVDFNKIRDKIKDIIVKSIISVYQNLTLEQTKYNKNDINFYEILGFDIIIKNNYEPKLLEINTGPCKIYHNELDKQIKTNLVIDTLNIIGISIYKKNKFIKNMFKYKNFNVEDNVNNALCELTRPRGDYELIFPLKSNINTYKKYFRNINTKENELFWEKIQN